MDTLHLSLYLVFSDFISLHGPLFSELQKNIRFFHVFLYIFSLIFFLLLTAPTVVLHFAVVTFQILYYFSFMATSSSFLDSLSPKIVLRIWTKILERLSALIPLHKRIYASWMWSWNCPPQYLSFRMIHLPCSPSKREMIEGKDNFPKRMIRSSDFDQTQTKVKAQSSAAHPRTTDKTKYAATLSPQPTLLASSLQCIRYLYFS